MGGTYAEHAKPMIRKGEEVYAYKGDTNNKIWLPGIVIGVNKSGKSKFYLVRSYDIMQVDNKEKDVGEILVSRKVDYEVSTRKPKISGLGSLRTLSFRSEH